MFDKKQKSCVKRIHLVTDDGLYNQKAFYKVEIVFIYPLLLVILFIMFIFFLELSKMSKVEKNIFPGNLAK